MLSRFLQTCKHLPTAVIFAALVCPHAPAEDVKVKTSGGFAVAYKVLVSEFEKSSIAHVDTVFGRSMGTTPGAIPMHLAQGEVADVVIMASWELDALAKESVVVEGNRRINPRKRATGLGQTGCKGTRVER
jgi:molybdate transport system substrate-binding protein